MKTMLLVSTLAGLVVATPSFAQSPPNTYSPAFGYLVLCRSGHAFAQRQCARVVRRVGVRIRLGRRRAGADAEPPVI